MLIFTMTTVDLPLYEKDEKSCFSNRLFSPFSGGCVDFTKSLDIIKVTFLLFS